MTKRPNAAPTSLTKVGRLFGERVTWKTALVISASPPTMSMWITARARAARSGRALSSEVVPSISGGQTKRIVRRGAASFPSRTSFARVRATSRIVEQPLALSFAPGRWWSRWQESTISWVRSAPGITPVAIR